MFDNVGNRSPAECRRVLTDDGICVVITGPKRNRLLGPIGHLVRTLVSFKFASQTAVSFTAEETAGALADLSELLESGSVVPVIERTYSLGDVPEAMRYLGTNHARAKLVVTP